MRTEVWPEFLVSDRVIIATYPTYEDAQKAVDHLADVGFPVQRTAIVAQDIRFIEEVTGRRGVLSSGMEGLVSGALTGAIVGLVLGFLSLFEPITSALILMSWGLVLGAVVGFLFGMITYALMLGRRDFSSVRSLQAGRFDVIAEHDVAHRGTEHLRTAQLLRKPKR